MNIWSTRSILFSCLFVPFWIIRSAVKPKMVRWEGHSSVVNIDFCFVLLLTIKCTFWKKGVMSVYVGLRVPFCKQWLAFIQHLSKELYNLPLIHPITYFNSDGGGAAKHGLPIGSNLGISVLLKVTPTCWKKEEWTHNLVIYMAVWFQWAEYYHIIILGHSCFIINTHCNHRLLFIIWDF